MMPGPGRSVRVIAEKDKPVGSCRRIAPLEWRGYVFAVAGKTPRDRGNRKKHSTSVALIASRTALPIQLRSTCSLTAYRELACSPHRRSQLQDGRRCGGTWRRGPARPVLTMSFAEGRVGTLPWGAGI